MSTLSTITAHLIHIEQVLVCHPVFTRGTGVTVDDPAFIRETEELERLSDRLDVLIRSVRNQQHWLSKQEQGLWNVPREKRYGPASAIAQQQAEAERLMQAAADVRKLLDDLLRRSGLVSAGDAADKIGEFIKQWHEHSHEYQHAYGHAGSNLGVPSYLPAGHFQATPEGATIAVFAALRALTYFVKRKKGRAA